MTYSIDVYCSGRILRGLNEPSHPDRRAYVINLQFIPAGTIDIPGLPPTTRDMWVPGPVSRRWEVLANRPGETSENLVQYVMDDGRVLDRNEALRTGQVEDRRRAHMKYLLRCNVCGLDYQFLEATLDPILTRLRSAAVAEVSLPALGALVR